MPDYSLWAASGIQSQAAEVLKSQGIQVTVINNPFTNRVDVDIKRPWKQPVGVVTVEITRSLAVWGAGCSCTGPGWSRMQDEIIGHSR